MKGKNKPSMAYPRLTHPLVRDQGKLREASWDEALGRLRKFVEG